MIEFSSVTKKYDHGITALEEINVNIKKGEFVFLVGPSGSGKSTFLKTMMGMIQPLGGEYQLVVRL